VKNTAKKCAGGKNDRRGIEAAAVGAADAGCAPMTKKNFSGHSFIDVKIISGLQGLANPILVGVLVGLGAGALNSRTFGAVQDAKLNAGCIGGTGHQTAEGVDLADQLTLADTPDGGIAAHLGNGIAAEGHQQGAGTHPAGSPGGLGSGMSAPNNNNIIIRFHSRLQ